MTGLEKKHGLDSPDHRQQPDKTSLKHNLTPEQLKNKRKAREAQRLKAEQRDPEKMTKSLKLDDGDEMMEVEIEIEMGFEGEVEIEVEYGAHGFEVVIEELEFGAIEIEMLKYDELEIEEVA